MNSYNVDYSELVTALQEYQQHKAAPLLERLLPILQSYLRVNMNASDEDAREAVHQAFLNTYEKILANEIRDKKYIFKYILKACRYEYLRFINYQERFSDEFPPVLTSPAEQITHLLDQERQKILERCMEELPEKSRVFITYIFKHPQAPTKSISAHFDISEASVRTKKSRIISDLSHCVQKKWQK